MNRVVKWVLIAAIMIVVCWAVLTATKSYGVWVISGIAVVLFCVGMLGKESPIAAPDEKDQEAADPADSTEKKENP
jgi:hypothetical protein